MRARFGEIRYSSCRSCSISPSTHLKQCRLCAQMRDALSSVPAVTGTEKLLSACVILVLVFPAAWPSNFSSHSFRQKPRGLEWDWRSLTASSRRTAECSRARIVTMGAPALRFACLTQKRRNQRRHSFVADDVGHRGDERRGHRERGIANFRLISLDDGVRIKRSTPIARQPPQAPRETKVPFHFIVQSPILTVHVLSLYICQI